VGIERERHAAGRPETAGVRTFAIASGAGAIAAYAAGPVGVAVTVVAVAAIAVAGYLRTGDVSAYGITTEVALVAVTLLGALATVQPAVAAGSGVVVAILLRSRSKLHSFVTDVLTADELWDALILLAAVLVILPLVPDQPIGPQGVLNPRSVIELAVVVMAISSAGHIAQRWLGPRYGLPITGFASGFVSSAATVASMGSQARQRPDLINVAVAGAVLSTVSTHIQMAVVLWVASPEVLRALALPLLLGGAVAAAYGGVFTWRAVRSSDVGAGQLGRAFNLKWAVAYALIVGLVIMVAAWLETALGQRGLAYVAAAAGFADAHSAAFSAASVAASRIGAAAAVVPVLLAMSTNAITKTVVAITTAPGRFAWTVVLGLVLSIAGAWAGVLFS
jgi:uncharacterized membrane protein (DUF4010 family)